jgi:hypothetical protein
MAPALRAYDARLAKLADRPSIVLFKFDEKAALAAEAARKAKEEAKANATETAGANAVDAAAIAVVSPASAMANAIVTTVAAGVASPLLTEDEHDYRLSVHAEPVYNVDVAWPDDARVIRAHDLGPERDRALFAYYARVSPDRAVYVYDRAKGFGPDALTYLGTAKELHDRAGK